MLLPALYPDVSLLMKMCVQRKAGRRQWASPAICTLPMVPCGSFPVTRLYLAKNEVPEEEAGVSSMFIGPSTWKQKIYQTVSPPLPPNISPPPACLKMNSMIYFHIIRHPVVHMYDFHIFMNLTLYDVLKLIKGSNSTSISISAATEQLWHCYVACFEN